MVLAYDLSGDKCMIDGAIISKFTTDVHIFLQIQAFAKVHKALHLKNDEIFEMWVWAELPEWKRITVG